MLEALFNSTAKERALLYLYTYQEGYGQEIARTLELTLRNVQVQLKKLEEGGVLVCRKRDRTLLYQLNPRYPFYKELCSILEKMLTLMPLPCWKAPMIINNSLINIPKGGNPEMPAKPLLNPVKVWGIRRGMSPTFAASFDP